TVRAPTRAAARRAARRLAHYFEGSTAGKRYPAVRASRLEEGGWGVACVRRAPAAGAGHFEELAHEYDDEIAAHVSDAYQARKLERVARHVKGRSHARVLDLGCGVGAHARELARRVPGAHVVGMD